MQIPWWGWAGIIGGGLWWLSRSGTTGTTATFDDLAKFAIKLNPGAMATSRGSGVWLIATPKGTTATVTTDTKGQWMFAFTAAPAQPVLVGTVRTAATLDALAVAVGLIP